MESAAILLTLADRFPEAPSAGRRHAVLPLARLPDEHDPDRVPAPHLPGAHGTEDVSERADAELHAQFDLIDRT